MARDPLTKEEREDFLIGFVAKFEENYQAALQSGSYADVELASARYLLAKCTLVVTAEQFDVSNLRPDWKAFMKNLRHYV